MAAKLTRLTHKIAIQLYEGRGLAMGQPHEQRGLPKCLNGFIVSEVKCESEQAREPNA